MEIRCIINRSSVDSINRDSVCKSIFLAFLGCSTHKLDGGFHVLQKFIVSHSCFFLWGKFVVSLSQRFDFLFLLGIVFHFENLIDLFNKVIYLFLALC